DGNELRAFRLRRRRGEFGRQDDASVHRPAHRGNATRFVDRWADYREVQTILAADVAVEHFADVQPEVDRRDGMVARGAALVHRLDAGPQARVGAQRAAARLRGIVGPKD